MGLTEHVVYIYICMYVCILSIIIQLYKHIYIYICNIWGNPCQVSWGNPWFSRESSCQEQISEAKQEYRACEARCGTLRSCEAGFAVADHSSSIEKYMKWYEMYIPRDGWTNVGISGSDIFPQWYTTHIHSGNFSWEVSTGGWRLARSVGFLGQEAGYDHMVGFASLKLGDAAGQV